MQYLRNTNLIDLQHIKTILVHNMKRIILSSLFIMLMSATEAKVKHELSIPDLGGYKTLKFDFHCHTVFSDGLVWPTVRVDEAWCEDLDGISITEHIEYRPHNKDLRNAKHGRSYDIAKNAADAHDILLIKGSEITRGMPPGHFNALFLDDCEALDKKEWRDAFKAAKKQNAFIFWNHPGWYRQQPDTTLWLDEHSEIFNNGWMHGIEIANGNEYFPEAHKWCIEKNLTMLGNSDIHRPSNPNYAANEHRTITLVLASDRTPQAIRDALDNRRTLVYVNNLIIGEEKYLRELFEKSVRVVSVDRDKRQCRITLENGSDLPFILEKTTHNKDIVYFRTHDIKPKERTVITVNFPEGNTDSQDVNFRVKNLLTGPDKYLDYRYSF